VGAQWANADSLPRVNPIIPMEFTMTSAATNPFALLVCPETVTRAVAHSDRLARLSRRVCRPLDKPLIPLRGAAHKGLSSVD
jgi:hypothetical protein